MKLEARGGVGHEENTNGHHGAGQKSKISLLVKMRVRVAQRAGNLEASPLEESTSGWDR